MDKNRLSNSSNLTNSSNSSNLMYFLLGVGLSSLFYGIYYVTFQNVRTKTNQSKENAEDQKKEVDVTKQNEKEKKKQNLDLFSENLYRVTESFKCKINEMKKLQVIKSVLIKQYILPLIKEFSEELIKSDSIHTPNFTKITISSENINKEYQDNCLDYFKDNSKCYEIASNIILKDFNLTLDDINEVIKEDRKYFKELHYDTANYPNNNVDNIFSFRNSENDEQINNNLLNLLTPSEVKSIFLNYSKRYLGEVLLLENNLNQAESLNEEFYYFKLQMINLYNNEILVREYNLSFNQLLYLVRKNNLLNDFNIQTALKKLKMIELILAGLIE